jgi:hypothetical protein
VDEGADHEVGDEDVDDEEEEGAEEDEISNDEDGNDGEDEEEGGIEDGSSAFPYTFLYTSLAIQHGPHASSGPQSDARSRQARAIYPQHPSSSHRLQSRSCCSQRRGAC